MSEPQTQDHLLRVTPLTYVLVVVLALVGALCWWPGRDAARSSAADQAAIEKMVKETNDLYADVQKIRDDTRTLMDPLMMLLELDRRLEAEGLPPIGGKEFIARLAEENRKLVASGSPEYIDTCAQKGEVEKHLLYQGLHGPIQALPGWSKDWETACITILPQEG